MRHFLRMFMGIALGLIAVGFVIYFIVVVRLRLKRKHARERAEELEGYKS